MPSKLPLTIVLLLLTIGSGVTGRTRDWHNGLEISTTSGIVTGKIDPAAPHVRQFLGIPYARPPVDGLRWRPPRPIWQPHARVDGTKLPSSCMQYFSTALPSTFTQEILQYNVQGLNGTPTSMSEDCLALGIWTPTVASRLLARDASESQEQRRLPVLLFIYGGGFGNGGIDVPYAIPTQWVERTRDHLVVVFNYRLNIFGFPNAAGLKDQNLGLLDQRVAVEWVAENIAAFGGDPQRIVLWGQSAGSISVDYFSFTYAEDAIVSGLIMDSGTAQTPFTTTDFEQTNFTFVAENVGCPGLGHNPTAELACMRKVEAGEIEDFIAGYQGLNKAPGIAFLPVVDEKVVFANYTSRALQGKQARIPAIIGTDAQDGEIFANYLPYSANGDFDHALAELSYLSLFLCPQTQTARDRQQTGLDTWVYLYSGNFSNVSPLPWLGAYHGSELPMLFGTHANYRGPSTRFEYATSHVMQDAWVAFARDSDTGLQVHKWKKYGELGEADVRKFGDGVPAKDIEIKCVRAAPAN